MTREEPKPKERFLKVHIRGCSIAMFDFLRGTCQTPESPG